MIAESRAHRWQWALLLLTIGLLALRFCHLSADFPVFHFYNQDGARYTDEGFYTGAALQHFTLGHAYIPGGWNPGVFMPVWPFLVGLVFHFTGISVVAARTLAVGCVCLSVLLAYAIARQYESKTFACLTAFLIAANALGFFFGRLALLEPAFGMFLLLAIYFAGRVRPGSYALAVLVGVVFVVATLTKTTGPFVLPAVLFPIWANNRHDRAAAWKLLATAFATIIFLMGVAKIVWARHYAADAQIILGMAPLWQLENSPSRLLRFFFRGTWIDPVLFPLALAAFIAAARSSSISVAQSTVHDRVSMGNRLCGLHRVPLRWATSVFRHHDCSHHLAGLDFFAMDVEREQTHRSDCNRLRGRVRGVERRVYRGLSTSSAVHPGRCECENQADDCRAACFWRSFQ